jgi:Dyp-type peroxidase family
MKKPLNPNSAEATELFKELQGNILKGHGRDHAMHLFISFGSPKDEASHVTFLNGARDWISHMLADHVTSAEAQINDPDKEEILTILLLSSQGYEFLGENRPEGGAFREGMRERSHKLNDPKFDKWSPRYQHNAEDIHALVIVAAPKSDEESAKTELEKMRVSIESELKKFGGAILVDQRGRQERNGEGRAIEHFGYVDGVSQPQFIDDGRDKAKKFDQRAPLKIVLDKDRHGCENYGYGSFFVYRLLEQNVDSFNGAVLDVARELDVDPQLVGAMGVGRFKNGTPVTTFDAPETGYRPSKDEDFDYDDDSDGNRCPYHGHIRKTNPRGDLGHGVVGFIRNLLARENTRRIARRGITYTDEKNNTVGLIFMCFQSDINDQFEFMQKDWANGNNFSRFGTGLDPLIGQDGGPQEKRDFPNWPTEYDSEERKRIKFGEHVKFLGGEYFFAPSISGLKKLAKC